MTRIATMLAALVAALSMLLAAAPTGAAAPVTLGVLPSTQASVTGRTGLGVRDDGATFPAAAPSPSPHRGYGPWHRERASWFGPGLYGRHTACGQVLTKTLVGYASRTGKCGELREFRWRGKTLIAPKVDWGPAVWTGHNLDLTAGLVIAIGRVDAKGRPFTDTIDWRWVR